LEKLEVLVATMHQNNLSKYQEMNIQTGAVFANQSDNFSNIKEEIDNKLVRMITTNQRGVGKNRNVALLNSCADICLLSDDDVVYVNGYEEKILKAFKNLPEIDILIFNIETKESTKRRTNKKIKRVRIHNFLNYGAVRIAFRRESIVRKNIWFSLLFGGGAMYGSGEDNLFLREALRKNLKICTYPLKIADVKEETSTWFTGYNEKYFFDKGALLGAGFPRLKYLFALYFMLRFKSISELSSLHTLKQMVKGMKAFEKGMGYMDN
jgi:glycosyltransferase involved in cell wall biosynthesis